MFDKKIAEFDTGHVFASYLHLYKFDRGKGKRLLMIDLDNRVWDVCTALLVDIEKNNEIDSEYLIHCMICVCKQT